MLAAAGAAVVAQSAHGDPKASGLAVSVLFVAGSTLIGLSVAERRHERRRERRRLADNAAAEERVRIARELHDVVAHHLSVMVVQANVVAEAIPQHESDRTSQLKRSSIADVAHSPKCDGSSTCCELTTTAGINAPPNPDWPSSAPSCKRSGRPACR